MTRARSKSSASTNWAAAPCWPSSGESGCRIRRRTPCGSRSPTARATSELFGSIVRSFLRDRHVVHVAFADACRRDTHELRFALQRRDVAAAAVAHARAQTANELINQ